VLPTTRADLLTHRWPASETPWTQARQQTGTDETTGVESASPAVSQNPWGCQKGDSLADLDALAGRTHRERKELYIKALEDEVLRLKEIYSNVSQDKDKLAQENRQLKSLLSQSGLGGGLGGGAGTMAGGSSVLDDAISNPSAGYTSSPSVTGSYAQAPSSNTSSFTPPLSATNMGQPHAAALSHSASHHQQQYHRRHLPHHSGQGHNPGGTGVAGGQPDRNPPMDFDQAGIDFVLTYENPSRLT